MSRQKAAAAQFARITSPDAQQYAPLLGYLLTPAAAAGYAMAFWRFASDMRWLSTFVIAEGLLSRWQVWLAIAVAAQAGAHYLNRRNPTNDGGTVTS